MILVLIEYVKCIEGQIYSGKVHTIKKKLHAWQWNNQIMDLVINEPRYKCYIFGLYEALLAS